MKRGRPKIYNEQQEEDFYSYWRNNTDLDSDVVISKRLGIPYQVLSEIISKGLKKEAAFIRRTKATEETIHYLPIRSKGVHP